MINLGRWRYTHVKGLLLVLFAAFWVVAIYRLFVGLGAVTNMSNHTPWGIWKAFDVIVVVPLGACGFTMAFVRYFLKADQYEYITRRSVVWAIIMYTSMGIRLFFDVGVPWRLPMPLIFGGNFHSPLLEVAWCVALYLIVLVVENLPRVAERMTTAWAHKLEHAVHWVAPAFVLFGVLLSSMHQSSLGTLSMAFGRRMDPLWYHPWLNYIYLLTAVATGLSVAILLEYATKRLYETSFRVDLLSRLAVAASVPLTIVLVWRVGSIVAEGQLAQLLRPRFATGIWWVEILVGYLLPLFILSRRAWRNSQAGLVWASAGIVLGMALHRLNVVFTSMSEAMQSNYSPSILEWVFTIGATAGTLVLFTVLVESLPGIIGRERKEPQAAAAEHPRQIKAATR